jgi:hypothetical protein
MEDELLMNFRPARRSFFKDYIIVFIILGSVFGLGQLGFQTADLVFYSAIGVCIIIMGYVEIVRMSIKYSLTKKKIIRHTGLVKDDIDSIFIKSILDINLSQGLTEKILGYGDIIINSKTSGAVGLKGVKHPKKIVRKIEKLMSYKPRDPSTMRS